MAVQSTVTAAPNVAFAGMLADFADNDILSMRSNETVGSGTQSSSTLSTSIPFGVAVVFKTAAPVTDQDVTMPHAITDVLAGIVVHKQNYARTFSLPDGTVAGELDNRGLVPTTSMNVLRRGRIWVSPPASVKPGDRFHVRAVANGAISNQLGSIENAADGANTIACTTVGQFLSSCAANGFAKLEVDFTNKPA